MAERWKMTPWCRETERAWSKPLCAPGLTFLFFFSFFAKITAYIRYSETIFNDPPLIKFFELFDFCSFLQMNFLFRIFSLVLKPAECFRCPLFDGPVLSDTSLWCKSNKARIFQYRWNYLPRLFEMQKYS